MPSHLSSWPSCFLNWEKVWVYMGGEVTRFRRYGRARTEVDAVTAAAPERAKILEEVGSLGWTRTNDQRINSPTLYRLSYQGTENQEGRAFSWLPLPASSNPTAFQ